MTDPDKLRPFEGDNEFQEGYTLGYIDAQSDISEDRGHIMLGIVTLVLVFFAGVWVGTLL